MSEKKSLGPQGLAGFKDFIHLDSFPIKMLKLRSAISTVELCQGRDGSGKLDSASPEPYSDPLSLTSLDSQPG